MSPELNSCGVTQGDASWRSSTHERLFPFAQANYEGWSSTSWRFCTEGVGKEKKSKRPFGVRWQKSPKFVRFVATGGSSQRDKIPTDQKTFCGLASSFRNRLFWHSFASSRHINTQNSLTRCYDVQFLVIQQKVQWSCFAALHFSENSFVLLESILQSPVSCSTK